MAMGWPLFKGLKSTSPKNLTNINNNNNSNDDNKSSYNEASASLHWREKMLQMMLLGQMTRLEYG